MQLLLQASDNEGGQSKQTHSPFGRFDCVCVCKSILTHIENNLYKNKCTALPPNAIQVTEEEKLDIDDIVSMGFNEDDAIEAYLACDKQKELAINYLFDARENGALLCKQKLDFIFLKLIQK